MSEADDFVPVEHMDLVGGDLSLDFTNTATGRVEGGPPGHEKLREYGDLVTWGQRVGLLGEGLADRLRRRAERSPGDARSVLERARALRETIYRVFAMGNPDQADLDALAKAAAAAAAERRLARSDAGFAFVWPDTDALDRVLWPVAMAAAELLTSEDHTRVKECASDTCNWLFVDLSRNRSRRWCDMKDCGNRAKARRFYARQKQAKR